MKRSLDTLDAHEQSVRFQRTWDVQEASTVQWWGGRNVSRSRSILVLLSLSLSLTALAEDKVTYQDQVLPLVEANCSKCHNADKKKADLDLTSYQGALKGSGSGAVVVSGNLDGSKLWKAVTHAEEPNMPPNRPKLDDKELELFKKWILGGL